MRIAIDASGGRLRMTAVMRIRTSGSRWTTRKIRASRASRRIVVLFWSPGTNAKRDGEEVEDVPALAEVVPRPREVGGDAKADLDGEDREAERVQQVEQVAVLALEPGVGLQPENEGVREDHRDDHRNEHRRVDQSSGSAAIWRGI